MVLYWSIRLRIGGLVGKVWDSDSKVPVYYGYLACLSNLWKLVEQFDRLM